MKNLILLFSLILFFSSCSQNEEEKNSDNSIVGIWKLIEFYSSDGGSNPQWRTIENGYTYTFYNNDIVKSSKYECDGAFSISNSIVHLAFDCNNSKINGNFDFKFIEKNLILTPNPNTCFEGCNEKFMKIQ